VIDPEEGPGVRQIYSALGDTAAEKLHTQYHRVEKTIVPQLEAW
jgi:hypothetical protein